MAELIHAGSGALRSEIHKFINFPSTKGQLPDQLKDNLQAGL